MVLEQGTNVVRNSEDAPANQAGVTVVVPVYNCEKFVERTIRSAAAQTYPNLKIIAVDDGSTDRSREILAALAHELPCLEVHLTQNSGVARARNLGTESADTEYVAYLDHDDLWHPTKIEKQMAALLEHADDPSWAACYTANRVIDEDDRLLRTGIAYPARGFIFGSHLVMNHVGNGSNFLVRRQAALDVGGFDPSYKERGMTGLEDWDFQLRILQHYKSEYVPECLVGYRMYDGTMSQNYKAVAQCALAVAQKFSSDPRVSPALRRVAMSAAHRYAALRYFLARRYGHALRHFVTQLMLDPRFGPPVTIRKMSYRCRDWMQFKISAASQNDHVPSRARAFHELKTTELLEERDARRFRSLEVWLARMDKEIEAASD